MKFSSSLRLLLCYPLALAFASQFVLTPAITSALDEVSAQSLKRNLTYIASDELEGRDTPSPGLDLAAIYIARQFQQAGLEPISGGKYYHTAKLILRSPDPAGFVLQISRGPEQFSASFDQVDIQISAPLDLRSVEVIKVDGTAEGTPPNVTGRVALVAGDSGSARLAFRRIRQQRPAAILLLARQASKPVRKPELADPEDASPHAVPIFRLYGRDAQAFVQKLHLGPTGADATITVRNITQTPVEVQNVGGMLRGSDPVLKETYVLVSAHYDHLGMKDAGEGDRIFNGANDDGSGTVSVIEVAKALLHLRDQLHRSILFLAFFGEEEGLYGSRYYTRHPIVPLAKTVADVNLEQLGRTDATEGRQVRTVSVTGEDYSDLTKYFEEAGGLTGIKINHDRRRSDAYFAASDNYSFAEAGIPAETLAVAFEFPDYHGVGDEADKIDYENMAKVDRMVALSVLMIADANEAPQWNAANRKTEKFRNVRAANR